MKGKKKASINVSRQLKTTTHQASTEQERQRSRIVFPYDNLDASIGLAAAIHANARHGECGDDQLAAWANKGVKSSGFRTRVYAARIFGVLEGEGSKHKLTELGRAIVDPRQEPEARVRAFLNVPLYSVVFRNHKGGVLPSGAALEREIVRLGVAEKQKGRARRVFERSAEQAGFFDHDKTRLIMPSVTRNDQPSDNGQSKEKEKDKGESSIGSGGGPSDPLIAALIQKLPEKGPWTSDDRVMWLKMVAMVFQMAYGLDTAIDIRKSDDLKKSV
jgi:hypothetical protein